jgi:hypothetical protein
LQSVRPVRRVAELWSLYDVRYEAISFLAGMLCFPATYQLTREGSVSLSVGIVVFLAVAGTLLTKISAPKSTTDPWLWRAPLVFVLGALVSEAGCFAYYYIDFGYSDPKLGVGIAVTVIEFAVIGAVGGAAACLTNLAYRRITTGSRRTLA